MKQLLLGCCAMVLVLPAWVSAVTHSDNFYADNHNNDHLAYMDGPETLAIEVQHSGQKIKVHLPRVQDVSEFSWSSDNRYLSFTTERTQLWLYDLKLGSLRLIESIAESAAEPKYLPQWSKTGNWLLYISHKNTQVRPRIYSPVKNYSYALPMLKGDFSRIRWAEKGRVLTLFDFVGAPQRIASFNLFGITLKANKNRSLTALNK